MRLNFLERRRQAEAEPSDKKPKPMVQPASKRVLRHWEESLWDYAVKVYSLEKIEHLCLQLQDDYHANVDIILWCCWLDAEKIKLSKETLDEVLITIDTVSQSTLLKLRGVRNHVQNTGAFTAEQSKIINKQLLNAELMIEKVLLYRLQDLTRRFVQSMNDINDPLDLHYYFEFLGIADGRKLADTIVGTCRDLAERIELR